MVVLLVVLGGLLMVALRKKFVSQKSHKCLGNGWWWQLFCELYLACLRFQIGVGKYININSTIPISTPPAPSGSTLNIQHTRCFGGQTSTFYTFIITIWEHGT